MNMEMIFRDDGWTVKSPLKHLSIGLFRDENTGMPGMLVGLNAFRKIP